MVVSRRANVGLKDQRPLFMRVRGSLAHLCSLPVYGWRLAAHSGASEPVAAVILCWCGEGQVKAAPPEYLPVLVINFLIRQDYIYMMPSSSSLHKGEEITSVHHGATRELGFVLSEASEWCRKQKQMMYVMYLQSRNTQGT